MITRSVKYGLKLIGHKCSLAYRRTQNDMRLECLALRPSDPWNICRLNVLSALLKRVWFHFCPWLCQKTGHIHHYWTFYQTGCLFFCYSWSFSLKLCGVVFQELSSVSILFWEQPIFELCFLLGFSTSRVWYGSFRLYQPSALPLGQAGSHNLGPSAYQPSALPPGQAGSQNLGPSAYCNLLLLCYTDRCIYLNLSKSTQSTAWLKAFETCCQYGCWLMHNSLPYYFHLLYRSTFIILPAKRMLALFMFS